MTRSYCRLWEHVIFSTKYHQPLITKNVKVHLYDFIADQLKKCDCLPLAINGAADHVHLLFLSNYKMSLADIMKQVKGASSYLANKNKLTVEHFGWQDSFGAFSVSEQNVEIVKRYIQNQEAHHSKKTFRQEYDELMQSNGLVDDHFGDAFLNAG